MCLLQGVPALGGVPASGEGLLPGGEVPAQGGACSRGCGDPPSVMATAADGAHPTGMHSC